MSDDINHIKTNNLPLLDELIYNLKKEMLSAIIKDDDLANNETETLETKRDADEYISCIEGRARPEIFHYTKKEYYNILSDFSEPIVKVYIEDPQSLPSSTLKNILTELSNYFINNYEEQNKYYRILNGIPPLNEEGIYLDESLVPRDLFGIDISIPIHKFMISQIDILYALGVIDKVILQYPDYEYLKHMGSRSISFYNARKASNFSLLYVSNDVPSVVYDAFRRRIEINRKYTLKTIYSEAYKFQSDYYNNFIRVLILIQTFVDILSEDMIGILIRREIFDRRMVELLFKTNGIDYFPEIPMTYQLAMIKNLNTLLRYKSTNKNIVDICSLFGFDNITVFKYYLLKERIYDNNTKRFKYTPKEIEDPNNPNKTITVEDTDKDINLKFVKVPIDDLLDDYLHDNTKVKNYDDVVLSDKYWDGDRKYEDVKKEILNLEFNHYQSKYISVDSMYEMAEMSFELCYFYNMLFDNVDMEEMLTLDIPYISGETFKYKFVDIICYLLSLGCLYEGFEDRIMDTRSKILYVKGFNFKADIETLANYMSDKGYTLEDLGVNDFQIPKTQVLSYKQLMNIFTTNKNIYDHVCKQIWSADNKRIYDIYKKLYDSLMIEKLTFDFFKNPDGTIAKTFKEFLSHRDIVLYNSIVEIENITDKDEQIERITDIINNCVYVIESSVDLSQYKFIFSKLPTVSAESIKQYIFKIVNFFKSYKVQIESINTVYIFNDRLDNWIKVIDNAIITHKLTEPEIIDYISKVTNTVHTMYKDKSDIIEALTISISKWIEKYYTDKVELKDYISKFNESLKKNDSVDTYDAINQITSKLIAISVVYCEEKIKSNILNTTYKDDSNIKDTISIIINSMIEKYLYELYHIKDSQILTSKLLFSNTTDGDINDKTNQNTSLLKYKESISINDSINIINI